MSKARRTSIVGELEINFEGFFACRIATDPDPTDEPRGMSGYTMALPAEDPLDQAIRLQIGPEYLERNARPPLREMFRNREFMLGVKVRSVTFGKEKAPWKKADGLLGAHVNLTGGDPPLGGPVFDSRNCITGNDDTMAFIVYPFNLSVGGGEAPNRKPRPLLTAQESLPPPWTMPDPGKYANRLSTFTSDAEKVNEVSEAINVYDTYGYFRDRRRYLDKLIADGERALADGTGDPATLKAQIEGYRSRIHQLEFWGDRVIGKLQARCDWKFPLDGKKTASGDLGGTVDTAAPWPITFWFGGWDGDLLLGYMRGTLAVPFSPA